METLKQKLERHEKAMIRTQTELLKFKQELEIFLSATIDLKKEIEKKLKYGEQGKGDKKTD